MNEWIPSALDVGPWIPDRNMSAHLTLRMNRIHRFPISHSYSSSCLPLHSILIQFCFAMKMLAFSFAPACWRLSIRNGHAKIDLIETTEPTVEQFYHKWTVSTHTHTQQSLYRISLAVCTFIFPFFWYRFCSACQCYTTRMDLCCYTHTICEMWIYCESNGASELWVNRVFYGVYTLQSPPTKYPSMYPHQSGFDTSLSARYWPYPLFNVVAVVDAHP